MKIHFLGTGAGVPSKYRNTQSMVFNFMQELKECWMIDCGEASQHKIMDTSIKPSKIKKIFISHLHGDHIFGLIGFLSSRSFLLNNDKSDLTIFGPKGIEDFVNFNMKISNSKLNYNITFIEYQNEERIYQDDRVQVEIFPLVHTIQSYGFKIKFKNQKGSLKVDKLKECGIMPGSIYKTIKENEEFEFNNQIYKSADFLEEDKKGKTITLIPDTVYFPELINFIQGSDIIISECTYLKAEELDLAKKHKHLNIINIYNFLNYIEFDKIYLTHISSRYDKKDIINIQESLKEKQIFIANDLDEYDL
ncbi:ribonuclease Z [Gemella sp. zg-1178]|uniref:ribonuclease Z n=1 Tax=Gemella sp. zg-1178 TaxID=2840372 RepID=UPI001C0486C3|nr:ribonuclease Z [Gemella sp. zg-1178]MBU0278786.1 ribonuclease Z [Gemella sp. zg-1178]